MPRTKRSLAELLSEPAPVFVTRNGQSSAIRRDELENLANRVPKKFHAEIMLPFTILRRTSLGRGAHTIGGSKLEQFIILQIIGKITAPLTAWREVKLPRSIYSPDVTLLRKKLPTTTLIGFGV